MNYMIFKPHDATLNMSFFLSPLLNQTSQQNKNESGGTRTNTTESSDGPSAAAVMVGTAPQTKRPKAPARPGEHEPAFDESLVLLDWCKFFAS